jgi:hypothetical protein
MNRQGCIPGVFWRTTPISAWESWHAFLGFDSSSSPSMFRVSVVLEMSEAENRSRHQLLCCGMQ